MIVTLQTERLQQPQNGARAHCTHDPASHPRRGTGTDSDRPNIVDAPANSLDPVPAANRAGPSGGSKNTAKDPAHRRKMDWLGGPSVQTRSVTATRKRGKRPRRTGKDFY